MAGGVGEAPPIVVLVPSPLTTAVLQQTPDRQVLAFVRGAAPRLLRPTIPVQIRLHHPVRVPCPGRRTHYRQCDGRRFRGNGRKRVCQLHAIGHIPVPPRLRKLRRALAGERRSEAGATGRHWGRPGKDDHHRTPRLQGWCCGVGNELGTPRVSTVGDGESSPGEWCTGGWGLARGGCWRRRGRVARPTRRWPRAIGTRATGTKRQGNDNRMREPGRGHMLVGRRRGGRPGSRLGIHWRTIPVRSRLPWNCAGPRPVLAYSPGRPAGG